jgi:hypothetical protein
MAKSFAAAYYLWRAGLSIVARIGADRKLPIPDELGKEFAPEQEVELVPCAEGLLVKPLRRTSLARALQRKVVMNQPTHLDLSEIDMDAIGW